MRRFFLTALFLGALVPSTYAAREFSDVLTDEPARDAIAAVAEQGIVNGYSDGTFRPDQRVNRAEFVKMVLQASEERDTIRRCDVGGFLDVPDRAWFAPYVCVAKRRDIVKGYDDRTFRPAEKITVGEAASMLASAFHLPLGEPTEPWYEQPLVSLQERQALPLTLVSAKSYLTRAQAADMIWRLDADIRTQPTTTAAALVDARCQWFEDQPIANVDLDEIRRVWISWLNAERKAVGAEPLRMDPQLNRTAEIWSVRAKDKGQITHKRDGQTAYYDYTGIEQWFVDQGLHFLNVQRSTFSESIGWGIYRCTGDCTSSLLGAIRSTQDMYLGEKGKASRPHYNSMVNPSFTRVGVGVTVDPQTKKYFITTHYATSTVGNPLPICP